MLLRWLMLTSTLPSALSTPTSLGNPCTMLGPCVLLMGKPVPAQVTVDPDTVQPEICWLAALIGTFLAARSAIASGMLLPQSPVTEMQFPASGRDTIEGVVTLDRKSTRLNSSHLGISYAVFCL